MSIMQQISNAVRFFYRNTGLYPDEALLNDELYFELRKELADYVQRCAIDGAESVCGCRISRCSGIEDIYVVRRSMSCVS